MTATKARATRIFTVAALLLSGATLPVSPAFAESFPVSVTDSAPPPPPPPPPPAEDRKSGNGAAVAMAIVGAALAGASCLMMMNAARQEPDPSKRSQLMAMALQQCAQAAMNAANAAQNKDGGKKLTDPAQPAPSSPKQQMAQAAPEKKDDFQLPAAEPEETPEPPAPVAETAAGVAEPAAFEKKPEQVAVAPTDVPKVEGTPVWNPLDPIANPKVNFDDNAKMVASAGAPGAAAGGAGIAQNDPGKGTATGGDTPGKSGKRAGKGGDEESHGQGGGGEGGETKKDGADGMDAMLAQLLGGGAKAGADGFGGGMQGEIIQLGIGTPGASKKEEVPNIFQYAAFRFHKAGEDGLVVTKRKPAELSIADRIQSGLRGGAPPAIPPRDAGRAVAAAAGGP